MRLAEREGGFLVNSKILRMSNPTNYSWQTRTSEIEITQMHQIRSVDDPKLVLQPKDEM